MNYFSFGSNMSTLALYDADYKKIMENLKAVEEASKEIIEFLKNGGNSND